MYLRIILLIQTLLVSACSGTSNLAEQIAAQGVYDSTNAYDRHWFKEDFSEGIKIQGNKVVVTKFSENIWDLDQQRWQDLPLEARSIVYLYVVKTKDRKFKSSCYLESYLISDAVTASKISITGSSIDGILDLKHKTSMRLTLIPSTEIAEPRAEDLLNSCHLAFSMPHQERVKQYYKSMLTTSWLASNPTRCTTQNSCSLWRTRFPPSWGSGTAVCRQSDNFGQSTCQLEADYGQSCPLFLTQYGLSSKVDDLGAVLVSQKSRSTLLCSKPGYSCLATSKGSEGFLTSKCLPELESISLNQK